jgi:hypothetical protein
MIAEGQRTGSGAYLDIFGYHIGCRRQHRNSITQETQFILPTCRIPTKAYKVLQPEAERIRCSDTEGTTGDYTTTPEESKRQPTDMAYEFGPAQLKYTLFVLVPSTSMVFIAAYCNVKYWTPIMLPWALANPLGIWYFCSARHDDARVQLTTSS